MPHKIKLTDFNTCLESFLSRNVPPDCHVDSSSMGRRFSWGENGPWRAPFAAEVNVYLDHDTRAVTVSWSSSTRTPIEALAAFVNYEKAVKFAALLEAFLKGLTVVDE